MKNRRHFDTDFPIDIKLTLEHAAKLNIYATLSHQTMEQAAAAILTEFLAEKGAVRIDHWTDQMIAAAN